MNIQEQTPLMFVKPFSVKEQLIKQQDTSKDIKSLPFVKVSKASKRIKKISKNKLMVNDLKSKTVLLFKNWTV